MDPAIKAQWIKALRSGEFTQGIGDLCRNNQYCCLGVLTVVSGNVPADARLGEDNDPPVNYDWGDDLGFGWEDVLDEDVAKKLGIDCDPRVMPPDPTDPRLTGKHRHDDGSVTLSTLNDAKFTFKEIADIIEAQL